MSQILNGRKKIIAEHGVVRPDYIKGQVGEQPEAENSPTTIDLAVTKDGQVLMQFSKVTRYAVFSPIQALELAAGIIKNAQGALTIPVQTPNLPPDGEVTTQG